LVVQVRPLGTIFRKIPQAAPPLIRRRDDGRTMVSPVYANRSADLMRQGPGVDRGVAGTTRSGREVGETRGEKPVETY